jgi:hypothetical protein
VCSRRRNAGKVLMGKRIVVGIEWLIRVAKGVRRRYFWLGMLRAATLTAQSLTGMTRVMKGCSQAKIPCDAVAGGIERRFAVFADFLAPIKK